MATPEMNLISLSRLVSAVSGHAQAKALKPDTKLVFKNQFFANYTIKGQDLTGATFIACQFDSIKFVECKLDGAKFTECRLDCVTFQDSSATLATFHDAVLKGVKIEKSDFKEADFNSATGPDFTAVDSKFEHASFAHSNLTACRFFDCDLSRARWMQASLPMSGFTDCSLKGATFFNGDLGYKTQFDGCDLTGADFKGARGSSLHILKSNLEAVEMLGAVFQDVSLTGSNLIRAKLPELVLVEDFKSKVLEAINKADERVKQLLAEGKEEELFGHEIEEDSDLLKITGAVCMDVWHTCGTVHCLGGWIVTIHPDGKLMESIYGAGAAASLILARCGVESIPDFFDVGEGSEGRAINWLKTGNQTDDGLPEPVAPSPISA